MSGITGGFVELQKMRANLLRMSGAPQRAAQTAAPLFEQESKALFGSQQDPSGAAWKPDAEATYRLGTRSVLYRSGALYSQLGAAAKGMVIKILIGVD